MYMLKTCANNQPHTMTRFSLFYPPIASVSLLDVINIDFICHLQQVYNFIDRECKNFMLEIGRIAFGIGQHFNSRFTA